MGLNARQSEIFRESKYLSLSRMKPFCTCMSFTGEGKKDWMVKERPRIFILHSGKVLRKIWIREICAAVFVVILGLFALFWLAFTCFHLFWLAFTSYKWQQFVWACSVNVSLDDTAAKWVRMLGGFRAFEERLVIPAWEKFAEERTEHRFILFGTDIDVVRPEKFWMEFVLMEKSDG